MGFLGSEMLPRLRHVAPLDEIHVVDPNWFSAPLPSWATLMKPDAWDLKAPDLEGFASVTMLSGMAGNQMVAEFPCAHFRNNLALPTYVASLAYSAGVGRFVFSSTTSMYESKGGELWTEEPEPRPRTSSAVVKLQVERALHCWASETFRVFTFRLGTICGWSQRPRLDLVMNAMCRSAVLDGKIRVDGADIWRSIVDVKDAAEVFALAAAGKVAPGTYNVVAGSYTLGQLAEAVRAEAAALGINTRIEVRGAGANQNFHADGSKLHHALPELRWAKPQEIARSILSEIRAWTPEQLNSNNYYNAAAFAALPSAGSRD